MTQVRFTIDDSDALTHAGKILTEIALQIAKAIEDAPESSRTKSTYSAVANLRAMALTLSNWASLVETEIIQRILDGNAHFPNAPADQEVH